MPAAHGRDVSSSSHGYKTDGARRCHNSPDMYPSNNTSLALKSKEYDKQSLGYLWRSGMAGGLAGCVAKTIVAPLDRVKILFQASNPQFMKYSGSWIGAATAIREIRTVEGFRGLYRGHSATIFRIFPYAGIKFLAYEQIRSILISSPAQETPTRRLASGSLAGIVSVFFTYPLEVIRVRLAFETKSSTRPSFIGTCKRIYGVSPTSIRSTAPPRNALSNFYRGFSVTVLGMLPYAGISFLTHDTAGDILRSPILAPYTVQTKYNHSLSTKPPPLHSWAQLLAGGLAGLISQTCAYPLEIMRRRMQVGGAVGDGHRLRINETFSLIFKENGIRGFWVGLTIGYVKVVPMAAASFYVYERAKTWFGI